LKRGRRWPGRAGNVLLLLALAAVPLMGVVALAVDFGRASVAKGKLDLAADSAALLATTAAANAWKAGDFNAVQEGIAAARARFQAQSANQSGVAIGAVDVSLTRNGGLFNATVTYTAQTPTTFAGVVGIATLPLGGQSTSSLAINPFVDIQILMDVSASMAIAATPADIARMQALTVKGPQGPCGFACHSSANGGDSYALALKNGVQLRITVMQQAVKGLIDTLSSLNTNNRFQLGLYGFAQSSLTIYPLSHDVADAASSLGLISPDVNDCTSNCPDTYFSDAMRQMTALDQTVAQPGTQVPQRFLFIVTDGVFDDKVNGARRIGPFNPNDCDALKALNVSVLVLYTPYTPLPNNSFWVDNVKPITPKMQPNLQACASSPSYFFTAADSADINRQMQNMLQLVIQTTSHLTK